MGNPLLLGPAMHGEAQDGAKVLLRLATVPPASIDVLGTLAIGEPLSKPMRFGLLRSRPRNEGILEYMTWRRQIDLVSLLRDSEPAMAKAAAALIASAGSS